MTTKDGTGVHAWIVDSTVRICVDRLSDISNSAYYRCRLSGRHLILHAFIVYLILRFDWFIQSINEEKNRIVLHTRARTHARTHERTNACTHRHASTHTSGLEDRRKTVSLPQIPTASQYDLCSSEGVTRFLRGRISFQAGIFSGGGAGSRGHDRVCLMLTG